MDTAPKLLRIILTEGLMAFRRFTNEVFVSLSVRSVLLGLLAPPLQLALEPQGMHQGFSHHLQRQQVQ